MQIDKGIVILRHNMVVQQEEADTIIVHQVAFIHPKRALVIADDTDVYLLLMHFSFTRDITGKVFMSSPIHGRAVLDISEAVERNLDIMPNLLAAHGITGCNTVGTYSGIGKTLALKALPLLGDADKSIDDVLPECTSFILACYNQKGCTTMTEARHNIWKSKVSRSTASAPKLQTLPPTNEAFRENVARAHLQVILWKNAMTPQPPDLNPTEFGWEKGKNGGLSPVTVPSGVALAPEELLKLIKYNCKSGLPCSNNRCGCHKTGIGCTVFCVCQGTCWNTVNNNDDDDNDDDNDDHNDNSDNDDDSD